MNTPVAESVVAEVARDLVAQVAPEELPIFRENSAVYFADPDRALAPQAAADDMLGFGAGDVVTLVTPVALLLVTEVLKAVGSELGKSAGKQGADALSSLAGRVFRKFRGGADANAAPPLLRPEQLPEFRRRALERARILGLPEYEAGLLVDALMGSLVVSAP